jgi:sulfate adenylyltransferase subunit 1 (EFTu-like GTPase family)
MFSENDLVARSKEDMTREVDELLADAKRLKEEHDAALQKGKELRAKSVETRAADAAEAEKLWQEAEELRDAAREDLRLSMENRLRAAEVQHRIDIHDQIESMDNSDEVWRKAAGAGRS